MINFEKIKPKKIKLSNYQFLRILGEGSFGQVKLAKNKKTNEYVAIKILKKCQIISSKQVDHIHNEVKILSMLDHPFIVHTDGFTQDSKFLYICLELANGGELFTYLRRIGNFSIDQARFYAANIAVIFEYLHSMQIIYRDLKPENILISNSGYLKLTDFGFAKFCIGRTYTLCGTPEYLAPEVLLNQGHGSAVDWWTFGVLLYEMIAGIDPFYDEDTMMTYRKIVNCKYKFPSGFDHNAKSLVKHLLQKDLTKRYGNLKNGAKDIKRHRFFANLDWNLLLEQIIVPPYIPDVGEGEVKNFTNYEETFEDVPCISTEDDPFIDW